MLRIPWWIVLATAVSVPAACTQPESPAASAVEQTVSRPAAPASRAAEPQRATASDAASAIPRIVMLGDSLTAGYGLDKPQSFPALLQQRLNEAGYRYEVVNAGVSGDTSAGGLRRLDWSLEGNVRVLVLELGANDGLRGLPLAVVRENLERMISAAKTAGSRVVLMGMRIPPNYGPRYTEEFLHLYEHLAKKESLTFIPFFLSSIVADRSLIQQDGMHPTADAQPKLLEAVWPTLKPLLRTNHGS